MRVTSVDAIPIALPVRRPWKWRGLHGQLGRWVIILVHTDTEHVGLGEATPLPDWGGDFNRYSGETAGTVIHVITDLLGPLLRSRDPFDIERIVADMDMTLRGHLYAKAALEMALLDLQGKAVNRPLYDLLGGSWRAGLEIAHMIGIMDPDEAVKEAVAALEDGCSAFQIKGTGALSRDVAVVQSVRSALGDDVKLRLDANQGYSAGGPKETIYAVRTLERAGIDVIEQPTIGLAGMAQVRAGVRIPVLADESCWQVNDVVDIVASHAADAISVYVAKAGGILGARKVATIAQAYGLTCDVNGSLEGGIGNAANVHLAVATPAITLPAVIPITSLSDRHPTTAAGRYYADDVVAEPFRYEAGLLYPPEGPGLGVELDRERLEAYRTDR